MSMKKLLDKNGILSSWMMIPNIYRFLLARKASNIIINQQGWIAATARLGGHSANRHMGRSRQGAGT